jgi:hypothetical protein
MTMRMTNHITALHYGQQILENRLREIRARRRCMRGRRYGITLDDVSFKRHLSYLLRLSEQKAKVNFYII